MSPSPTSADQSDTSTRSTSGVQRTAIVTGGSRGIGAHLVRALSGAGWYVVVCARSQESLREIGSELQARGHDFTTMPLDVSDAGEVDQMMAQLREQRPSIDLLVNCAGSIEAEVPIWEADPQQWWAVMVTNVKGPFLMTRAVAPIMIEQGEGRIINLNSGSAARSDASLTAYTASKSALARMTGGTASAGADHGLYAFDLAPGVIKTDMTQSMDVHQGRTQWTDPQDVTELALALASGELDGFSGRMVRAGTDDLDQLRDKSAQGLADRARTLSLTPWGSDDPLA
ncbi:SDR family oxidoreductase [soil metagenome]